MSENLEVGESINYFTRLLIDQIFIYFSFMILLVLYLLCTLHFKCKYSMATKLDYVSVNLV